MMIDFVPIATTRAVTEDEARAAGLAAYLVDDDDNGLQIPLPAAVAEALETQGLIAFSAADTRTCILESQHDPDLPYAISHLADDVTYDAIAMCGIAVPGLEVLFVHER